MATILDKIASYKREEVAKAKLTVPLAHLESLAKQASPVRSFHKALKDKIAAGQWALIAEIKKASPSKGLIRENFNPPKLASCLRAGRRRLPFRSHRYTVFPRRAGVSDTSPGRLFTARVAQGFHARSLSGA